MSHEKAYQLAPKLLTVIADRENVTRLESILLEKQVHLHYMFNAMGTASSELLKSLGLSGSEKTVCICMVPGAVAQPIMTTIADRLSLAQLGSGIAFIMPMSGISSHISSLLGQDQQRIIRERLDNWMDTVLDEVKEEVRYSLVVSVINQGFSEVLMAAAREVGARGGTIVHARRSGIEDAVKFFGVTLQAEKEIVTIVTTRRQEKALMEVIAKKCGFNTEAHGIVFSLPIENCMGISLDA